MGYPPLEELLPKAGNSVYKLIRMASTRAVELADGKPKLISLPPNEKTPTIALEEIRSGHVCIKEVASQFSAKPSKAQKDSEKNPDLEHEMSSNANS